ncbi:MAG: hypothetical protein ACOYOO_00065 [Saprospiraceae bacterium]|jgi:hypothetical protein
MRKENKDKELEEIKKNFNLKPVKKEDMKKIKGGKSGRPWQNGCSDIIPQ